MPKECDFIKHISEVLFRAVGLLFSALLLILLLLCSIDQASAADRGGNLKWELRCLQDENRVLQSEIQSRYSLEEIEKYAGEVLGMKHCSPEQIIYMENRDQG